MTSEQSMRREIEAAGLRVVQIGPLFGSSLDAIVENEAGQFLWSAWKKQMQATLHDYDLQKCGQQVLF